MPTLGGYAMPEEGSDSLIKLIRDRARNPATRTDQAHVSPTEVAGCVTNEDVASAERQLGFALPRLLQRIYVEVGNGGFGPGYGLMGLPGGFTDDLGNSVVDSVRSFREFTPHWPRELLPLCHWGCAIYSASDCSQPDAPVLTVDPSDSDHGAPVAEFVRPTTHTLRSWLEAWARGADLWGTMFPSEGG
jgi:hypothetical protein